MENLNTYSFSSATSVMRRHSQMSGISPGGSKLPSQDVSRSNSVISPDGDLISATSSRAAGRQALPVAARKRETFAGTQEEEGEGDVRNGMYMAPLFPSLASAATFRWELCRASTCKRH